MAFFFGYRQRNVYIYWMLNTLFLLTTLAAAPTDTTCQAHCLTDINNNGTVGIVDLRLFLKYCDGVKDDYTPLVDFNCDGEEDILDYDIFCKYYDTTVEEDCD